MGIQSRLLRVEKAARLPTEEFRGEVIPTLASTNTSIPYFGTEVVNTISRYGVITNNSTTGFSFKSNRKVYCSISFTYGVASPNLYGIVVNATALSSGITASQLDGKRIGLMTHAAGTNPYNVASEAVVEANTEVRPLVSASTPGTATWQGVIELIVRPYEELNA